MTIAKQRGINLLELMVTIAVAAILASVAIPSFRYVIDRNQLRTAAEELAQRINFARSESVKRNKNIVFSIQTVATAGVVEWCYGYKVADPSDGNNPCDCSTDRDTSDRCYLPSTASGQQPINTTVLTGTYPRINLLNAVVSYVGTATDTSSPWPILITPESGLVYDQTGQHLVSELKFQLQSGLNKVAEVNGTGLGRFQICTPSAEPGIFNYESCD